jgi:CheY-like chemotaxis protein
MMETPLSGLRILIVEDEALIVMLVEDTLADIGCIVVGSATTLEDALAKAASLEIDAALLDVNLNGGPTYPVADLLRERGVPFVFATGYGKVGMPDDYGAVPILGKPFQRRDLERVLTEAVAAVRGGPGQATVR